MSGASGVYLYCLARSDRLPAVLDGVGVDERAPLFELTEGPIAAVLSEVRLDDFTGPDAEARSRDLAWLIPKVMRHEQVIESVLDRSPVLPARFGTIFSSPDRVARLIQADHAAILDFLERTAGHQEWAVKGYLDRKVARGHLVEEAQAALDPRLPPGTRFLQERRLQAQADTQLHRWSSQARAQVRDELARHAADTVDKELLSLPADDTPGEMVANWAFLVPVAEVDAFRQTAARLDQELSAQGLALRCAGPFPPYSFTPALAGPGS